MFVLAALRVVVFLVLGFLLALFPWVPEFAREWVFAFAVINAIGLDTLWCYSRDAEFTSRRFAGYIVLLVVAIVLTANRAYAVPYLPYCEGFWKYVNWLHCR